MRLNWAALRASLGPRFDILDYGQRLSYRRSARIETVMEELQQNLKTMCQKIETLVERL